MNPRKHASDAYRSNSNRHGGNDSGDGKNSNDDKSSKKKKKQDGFEPLPKWLRRHNAEVEGAEDRSVWKAGSDNGVEETSESSSVPGESGKKPKTSANKRNGNTPEAKGKRPKTTDYKNGERARGAKEQVSRPAGEEGAGEEGAGEKGAGDGVVGKRAENGTVGGGNNPFSGFLKTGSGTKRAAKLLLLLGKEQAAEVLRHLSSEEVEAITSEIAKIKRIEKAEAEKILQNFGELRRKTSGVKGGYEVAKGILEQSLGKEEANKILKKVRPTEEDKPFAFLADLDYQQIMMLLRKESPHVVTLVLSYLNSDKASKVLESFPPDFQIEVVKRMATLDKVSPEALSTVEEKLKERVRTQGKVLTEEVEGEEVLAEILKHMPPSKGNEILDELESGNKEVAEHVRDRLYTVKIVNEIFDYDLQKILRNWDERELAIILKGIEEEQEERIYSNLSKRQKEFVFYEREHLGQMPRSEVDKSVKAFIDHIRGLIESGEIVLETEEKI